MDGVVGIGWLLYSDEGLPIANMIGTENSEPLPAFVLLDERPEKGNYRRVVFCEAEASTPKSTKVWMAGTEDSMLRAYGPDGSFTPIFLKPFESDELTVGEGHVVIQEVN